jgi:C4-dicarboxylate-specific signal transduction histidine kinase
MSADVARRVFEPFFTTKPIGEGSGLGLSISYGIVREFGGALSVRTEPGMGATFTIVLEQVAEGVEREADDLAGR